jgi:beta-mannanase
VIPDPLATGDKVALGVNTAGPPGQAITQFTRLIGVAPKIVMWFETWDGPLLYSADMTAAASVGAIPMLTWDPIHRGGGGIPLPAIAAGRYDSYIRSAARQAKAYGRLLFIRFAHEMNLPASPFGPGHNGNTAASFVAAWRHVVSIFWRMGADNAEFVWSPNGDCNGHCPFTAFYPGDPWVTWVALDGYNYGPIHDDRWMTFSQLFGPSYRIMTRLTRRPLMIGETACTGIGGDKAAWIRGMASALKTQFPRVRALVWFQRQKETDWRINSSPASLSAFRSVVKSAPFIG